VRAAVLMVSRDSKEVEETALRILAEEHCGYMIRTQERELHRERRTAGQGMRAGM
jgi:hypothetical protein